MFHSVCVHVCVCVGVCLRVSACLCVCVCVYLRVWNGKLAEPLRQVVNSSNTNCVKFLSCHRNQDGDSPLSFSQTTLYFTYGSELSIWDFIGKKQCHKQYLTILTFNIFFDALMSLDNSTQIVWPWEPELGVKDIFDGIPTLPSLSTTEMLIESCLPMHQ